MVFTIRHDCSGHVERETVSCCPEELAEIERDLYAHGATFFDIESCEADEAPGEKERSGK